MKEATWGNPGGLFAWAGKGSSLLRFAHADGELPEPDALGQLHDQHHGAVGDALVGLDDDDGVRVLLLGLGEGAS